jgi:hypothetical protein
VFQPEHAKRYPIADIGSPPRHEVAINRNNATIQFACRARVRIEEKM